MKEIFIVLLLLIRLPADSQPFANIDNRIKKIQANEPDTLASKLCNVYKTDKEKARAIFRWITENIAYDVVGYHKSESLYEGLWNTDSLTDQNEIEKDYNNKIVEKVLHERRAICDGYSRLFKTLCDYAGIKCNIVTGYIRWSSDSIGITTVRRHAWNAIFIENSWRLVDATWASGYCNADVSVFTKFFDDFFFLTDPVQLFNDHFPDDRSWSLLPNTPSLQEFYSFPFYYPDFYRAKISAVWPTTGIIYVKNQGRKVELELGISQDIKSFDIAEHAYVDSLGRSIASRQDQSFKIENGKLRCTYQVQSAMANRIDLYMNNKRILTYDLRFY